MKKLLFLAYKQRKLRYLPLAISFSLFSTNRTALTACVIQQDYYCHKEPYVKSDIILGLIKMPK